MYNSLTGMCPNRHSNEQWNVIAGTLGCVFIDNETHESGVTKCTTAKPGVHLVDTTRVCFIVNEHTTKRSCFYHTC